MQYSSTQSHFFPLDNFFVYFKNIVAFDLNKRNDIFMFLLCSVTSGLLCFACSKSCKDFFTYCCLMVFLTNTMESCFCYKQFIFVLYWRLLCNTTEISQNEGFIISSENMRWLRVLSLYSMPACTIQCTMAVSRHTGDSRHFLDSVAWNCLR